MQKTFAKFHIYVAFWLHLPYIQEKQNQPCSILLIYGHISVNFCAVVTKFIYCAGARNEYASFPDDIQNSSSPPILLLH